MGSGAALWLGLDYIRRVFTEPLAAELHGLPMDRG